MRYPCRIFNTPPILHYSTYIVRVENTYTRMHYRLQLDISVKSTSGFLARRLRSSRTEKFAGRSSNFWLHFRRCQNVSSYDTLQDRRKSLALYRDILHVQGVTLISRSLLILTYEIISLIIKIIILK